ncbi:hypothetical protein [Campylobacter sp. CCUG 57310]|uniref:hypothetical protein n=1 Tax=Campylobacter sp. CCUG 57310 TaxID=2517362 RepID=UPI001563B8D3|nr:hypothetical protein [Campylobacter sp. CCUG 57310]
MIFRNSRHDKKGYDIADKSKKDSDNEDIVKEVTYMVNGAYTGLDNRKSAYKRIKEANIFEMFK